VPQATVAEPLNAPFSRAEPRDPDIQSQVDDLRLALRDWRRQREYSDTTQKRLEQITMQCAQLVESWQGMQRRTGPAAGAAPALTGRVAPGTGERIRALERAIESEWEAIPTGAEDPARQISEQAASLVESCVTATNLALRGFENAENRLAAMEREIQSGLSQLSKDLQQVLTEIRNSRAPSAAPATPFPLEGVMRIHHELRDGDPAPEAAPALHPEKERALPQAAEFTTALAERVDTLEREVERVADAAPPPARRWWPAAAITLLLALATFALLGSWLQRRIDARLSAAAEQVAAAERQRDAAVAETRQEAARQVSDAQRTAAQAQIVGTVMAAPDLVRYWLTGLGESRAYAHVLISRSRGLVFSASRLRQPAEGQTYQLWILTTGGTVNAGAVTPDDQGRVTLVNEAPVILPGRLTGAVVTLEAGSSARTPSSDRVLVQID
jgi:hypothetical protein